jgi:signal transduction histidine kinase
VANDPACAAWTDETREVLSAIDDSQEGVQRISEIVSSMKEFSHPGVSGLAEADINRALETSLTVTRNQWKNVAKIERHLAPDLPRPRCDTGKINQVFLNLIVNAAQAIEESGKPYPGLITLSTSHVDGWVEIRIADTGTGIDAKTRERIFDPFFTTKPVGTGTGQGLAICHDVVVVKHGGTINISGAQGEGAEFIIRLPVSPAVDILGDDEPGIRQ